MKVVRSSNDSNVITFQLYATNEAEADMIQAVPVHMQPGTKMDYRGRRLHGAHMELLFALNMAEVIPVNVMFALGDYHELMAQVKMLIVVATDEESEAVVRYMRDILFYFADIVFVGMREEATQPVLVLKTDCPVPY